MKEPSFDGLSVDELWALYEKVSDKLAARMIAEQKVLEGRLATLRTLSANDHHETTLALIRLSFRSFEIQTIPHKPGRDAASSRAGSPRKLVLAGQ